MSVLVDTSVWSLALRKEDKSEADTRKITQLTKLVRDLDLVMIGPIRQEILSGISEKKRFEELRSKISIFEDFKLQTADYEMAAQFYNECRKNGIQGSHIDFLLCAVASNNNMSIFTLDKDFLGYKNYLPIRLEKIS